MPDARMTRQQMAKMIDHAVLKPDATDDDLRAACELCARLDVASLCVRSRDVARTAELLAGSDVLPSTVISFPHGATCSAVKVAEAQQAVADGAEELDMVLPIGALRSGDIDGVRADIAAVVGAASGRCVKVICECCYLTDEQIVAACQAARQAGAHYVKTSTGFGSHGAKVEQVRLMRETVGETMGVKASGGIRTLADALAMVDAGATRLGTSSGEAILDELHR